MNVIKHESVILLCLKLQYSISDHFWKSFCYVLPTAGAPSKFMLIEEGWISKKCNAINTLLVLAKAFQSKKIVGLYLLEKFVYLL